MFVALEGPNGVGKSTLAGCVVERMRVAGRWPAVVLTTEPTQSQFGHLIREMEGEFPPLALGLACAADRLYHLATEVDPALLKGAAVVTDRYVPSSLVLQGLDGLDTEEIWSWNATARVPDLTIYLEEQASVINARISARAQRSRFEDQANAQRELDGYSAAREFLGRLGWRQVVIACHGRPPNDIAAEVIEALPVNVD